MTRKFTFTILAMLFAILGPGAEAWGADTWEKLTSAPQAGDVVILVNETAKREMTGISTTSTKYGLATTYTTSPAGTYPLTVCTGNSTGSLAFKTSDNKYLYWTSGNSLDVNATLDNKTSWTVTVSDGNFTITNVATNARVIKYNKNSGQERFACYTSGQEAVQMYKKQSSTPVEPVAPSITTQPEGASYEKDATATALTIAASGTPTPTYQWYSNTTESTSGASLISGATNASYTPSTATIGTKYYYCVATNTEGSATSDIVAITVTAALPKITITADKIAEFTNTYAEYTWTANDVSGKCWAYRGGSSGSYNIQFNKTTYVYNTTAVPGRITSVKMTKVAGTTRSWSIYGADEALTGDNYTTAGTQIGSAQEVSNGTGTTWNVPNDKNYTYFYITKADGGTNIGEIVITYEEDNTPSIEANVEEIEFEQKELDGTVTDSKVISATGKNLTAAISASMKSGSAAIFNVTPVSTPTAAEGEFTVSYSATEAGEYAGTVVLSSGETSIEIPVSVKVIAHIPVLQSVAVSGTPDKTEYNEGEEFDPAGLTVTGTYDVGDPQTITEGIEWTVTPSGALAANVTSVSVVATVDGVASEAFNVDIIVVELPKWAKVTADKTDWSGEYLLVYENEGTAYVWTGVDAASCNVTATITDDQIIKPATAATLTIAAMDGGYSIQVNGGDNNGKYINQTSYANGMNISDNPSANTLSYDGTNTVIAGSGASGSAHVTMRYNTASDQLRFRYYKSGQKAVQLYEKVLNEAVTFAAPEGGSLVIKNGETPIESGATIQNGTVLDVTFGMTPAEAYKDVAIKVTKTDGGDDITSTVYDATKKQITMPRYAITVAVTFTKLYKISLEIAGEGTGSATMNGVTTDIYVDGETQINLVANAVAPNEFTKWSATDKILINDESAAETYASASGDGTITATFGISELQPLDAPTLSDPTNITYSGVTLNWQELANAEAYNVELLLNDETVASEVIIGETTWTPEVTLQANTTYTYTVQGVGDGTNYAEENNPKAQSTVTTADYPAVVLTLSENGIARNIPGKLNTPIDLPITSTQTCDGKVFMGWSATTIDGETDAKPSLLGETYTFTNPEQPTATIYAVYAKETPGESSNWEITSIDKTGTGTGYAAYNGSHTTDNISYTTSQIMMGTGENDNKMQFQKNAGMMYNTTPFGDDILFITIADITSNISVYEGSTEITTTPTSGAITLTNGKYTFSKGKKYFHIKMGSATGYSSKITVAVAGAPTHSNYCTTTPIVISGNIAWNNDVTISGNTVTIKNGAVLTVNGVLTNTNPANLIIEDGGQLIVNNSVQATMKKHIENTPSMDDPVRSWYTISSPLAASTEFANVTYLIPSSGVSNTSYDLYYLNEKDGVWVNARPETGQSSSFTKIDKGVGYIYSNAATTTIAFAGEVNVADVDVKLSLTADKGKGYNLIGNPFTQNIELTNVTGVTLAEGFYVLNNDYTWGTEPMTGEIKPLHGFLVQATEEGGTARISKNASVRGERSKEQSTNIEMIVSNANFKDNAYAMFGEGIGLNKVSHRNAQAPMLYVPQDGENFAIAFMDENTTVFPVSFKAMTTGKYSISLKATDDINTLVLVDNMTGAETNMLLEDSYTFIGSPRDNENRFTVKLKISNSQDEDEHFAYQNGSELVVNGEGTLQIFDVLGRMVISEEVHGQTVNVGGLNTGAYIVRLTGESVKTQKIVVR